MQCSELEHLRQQTFIKPPDQRNQLLVDGQHRATMPACQDGIERVIHRVLVADGSGQGFRSKLFVRLENIYEAYGFSVPGQSRLFIQIAGADIFRDGGGDFAVEQGGCDDQLALLQFFDQSRCQIGAQNDVGRRRSVEDSTRRLNARGLRESAFRAEQAGAVYLGR